MALVNFKKGTLEDYTQNSAQYAEYIYACTDTRDVFVFGVKQQGISDEIFNKLSAFDNSVLEVINAQKNVANGIAGLDANGKIDPSLVDGVVGHVLGLEQFVTENPTPVGDGKYYYNSTSKKILEGVEGAWEESDPQAQVLYNRRGEDENGHTNTLYRWDGAEMVAVSDPITIGTVTGTAYDGGQGQANRDALNAMMTTVVTGFGLVTANATQVTIAFTDADKNSGNNQYAAGDGGNIVIPAATDSAAGLMSAADKAALDALAGDGEGSLADVAADLAALDTKVGDLGTLTTDAKGTVVAAINEVDANADAAKTAADAAQADVDTLDAAAVKKIKVGTGAEQTPTEGLVTIANATASADGAMAKEDKTKLDTIINTGDGSKYLGDDLQYHDIPETGVVLDLVTDLMNGTGTATAETYQKVADSITNGIPVFIKGANNFTFAATAINAGTAVYLDVVMADMDVAEGAYKAEAVRYAIATTGYAITTTEKASPTLISNGDGTKFLADNGTYKVVPTVLSEDYAASESVNLELEPAAGDSYETAISKLHKAILDNEEVTAKAFVNFQTVLGVENPNMTMPDLSDTNYLNGQTQFVAALKALDAAIKTIADQAAEITDLESRVAALEAALTLKTVGA